MNGIFYKGQMRVETKLESAGKTRVCAQKHRLKMPFKNSLSGKRLRHLNHKNRMSVFALPLVDFQVWTGGKSINRKYQVLSLFPLPSSPPPPIFPLPPHPSSPSPLSSCLVTTVYTTIHLPSFMAIW